MRTFKDGKGKQWSLSVSFASLKRVKSILQVDLLSISEGTPPLALRLDIDPVLLVDVLFVLLKPDADAAGISDEQFGEDLGGDGFASAREAFWDELSDFFRGLRKPEMVTLIQKARASTQATINAVNLHLQAVDVEALVNAEMAKAFGDSSTDSPESSASIRLTG